MTELLGGKKWERNPMSKHPKNPKRLKKRKRSEKVKTQLIVRENNLESSVGIGILRIRQPSKERKERFSKIEQIAKVVAKAVTIDKERAKKSIAIYVDIAIAITSKKKIAT